MTRTRIATILGAAWLTLFRSMAAIIIPGADGSDGALNITTNTLVDLRQAITGRWDTNNAAHAGSGVYDPQQWAVVFKYTEVNIAAGATVTFTNHPSRAPVVWLVSGSINILGKITLNGETDVASPRLAESGPGGFRGGMSAYSAGADSSAGFGPGGGRTGFFTGGYAVGGFGGVHGSIATGDAPGALTNTVGNPSMIPLVGGSGGAGGARGNGGGGGGAFLIACAGALNLEGLIEASGGAGVVSYGSVDVTGGGGGAGGGVRLIASSVSGSGVVQALGGYGRLSYGGLGRIRIERQFSQADWRIVPDPSVIDLAAGATALLWPPAGAPEVRIVSIGGKEVPNDPRASFGTIGADVALPATATAEVIVETTNIEEASDVTVRGTPRSNGSFTEVKAVMSRQLNGTPLVLEWKAPLPANVGYSAVQVHVVRP